MKKVISLVLVCVLLVGCVCVLASCGGPAGKYEAGTSTYEFDGKNVKYTWKLEIGTNTITNEQKGTFEVKVEDDGDKVIVFQWEDKTESETLSYAAGTEEGTNYIKIGGIQYFAVK